MKLKFFIFILSTLILWANACIAVDKEDGSANTYLLKPTGKYGVGFQDFHWINRNTCPDFNYNGKNKNEFSPNNKKYCHEIAVRVYYPTITKSQAATPYYQPFIKSAKEDLAKIPGITSEQIHQLDSIRSYSIEKAPVITEKNFPALIFSPGFGVQAQLYENIISHLVSNGYIVIGVNTLFINGDIQLPSGHVVKAATPNSRDEANKKFLPLQMQDLSYVFEQLHVLHHANALFSAMDLQHIGVFGHSIGGRAVAKIIQMHPDWFQAAATLDIASYEAYKPITKFTIPFMHVISAYWKLYFSWPLVFELGNNGYLVTLSPSTQNLHYSYHMNYSDFSTLQYLPAYQNYLAYDKTKKSVGEDIKVMSHKPTVQERNHFNKPTYVLVKNKNAWDIFYYESGKKIEEISIDKIAGLQKALTHLPKKNPEQLTFLEIKPIQQAITAYHLGIGNFLGNGDGWKITSSVNSYLVQFFNRFLKDKNEPAFKSCSVLSNDTILQCGPRTLGEYE